MIRIAAIGDLAAIAAACPIRARLDGVERTADVLLVAGDLTAEGTPAQGRFAASLLSDLGIPTVAVLGERDHAAGAADQIAASMHAAGVIVLEGDGVAFDVAGTSVGISGTIGFTGGFDADATARATVEQREQAAILGDTLLALGTRLRIALLHYAPVTETLAGEPPECWHDLGHTLLSSAIDRGRASFAIHGHARRGAEQGATFRGVPVRNVAGNRRCTDAMVPPYRVYCVGGSW